MDIYKGLITFYRNLFVEKLGVLVSAEEGLLVRAEALNYIRRMTRQLRSGLTLNKETIYLEDVFDPAFNWWFLERHENMLRMGQNDCLTRSYEDFMHEMVFFRDEKVGEGAVSAPRIRNDLRQYTHHALKVMLNRESSARDIISTRERLITKIQRARMMDKLGLQIEEKSISEIFEDILLRDQSLLNRYIASGEFGGGADRVDGYEQLQQVIEECDLLPINTRVAELHCHPKAHKKTRKEAHEEMRKAQKALIDVLDGVCNRTIRFSEAASQSQAMVKGLGEAGNLLVARFQRYCDASKKDKSTALEAFSFSLLHDMTAEDRSSS